MSIPAMRAIRKPLRVCPVGLARRLDVVYLPIWTRSGPV